MADLQHKRSPTPPQPQSSEDPDTAAARKELKQTAISEKPSFSPSTSSAVSTSAAKASDPAKDAALHPDKTSSRAATPDRDLPNKMKDQVSSPKKKRAHDEVDEINQTVEDPNGDVSPIGANGRTDRSEPEKKRPRDVSSETRTGFTEPQPAAISDIKSASLRTEKPTDTAETTVSEKEKNTTSTTSVSAFSSSGLAGFASQASPFLQAGGKPLSSFASASGSQSPFGTTTSLSTPSVFGGSALSNGASPFGQIGGGSTSFGGSSFGGSAFGGGFSSALGGGKLTTFGNAGKGFTSGKPSKPFGAPESDEEDQDEDDEEAGSEDDGKASSEERDAEEKSTAADDKKKPKLQRVEVEDGEAGEASILQVRAKLYNLDKTSKTWKERGAGNLKINVPLACVDIDEENGQPIPGSFDASALEDAESKVARLIMRQDATHRVILNTVVIPAMSFQLKENGNIPYVLFTAIEGNGEAVPMQLKEPAADLAVENSTPNDSPLTAAEDPDIAGTEGPRHNSPSCRLGSSNEDSGYHSPPESRSVSGTGDNDDLAAEGVEVETRTQQILQKRLVPPRKASQKGSDTASSNSSNNPDGRSSRRSLSEVLKRKAAEVEAEMKGPMTRARKKRLSA
ncbi:hypothetical protein DL766_006288 [Monosporascus sp. MC13-8B]|uniref:RanBD1 domain-containing protein n=1 Tax=Monosporascus cannonballus TaxID=155416 RepID=A0ABY0HDM0_9PEZI|nr:hypothetical protein DL762_003837 [Monosporascus cannonballus]RYO92830.1 hypothetical protein DL763_004555 [Monosporascus cannonballus]RYP27693.1 hypothetical protein DL766_006288 [Monosporascus sp. MC13-8B]